MEYRQKAAGWFVLIFPGSPGLYLCQSAKSVVQKRFLVHSIVGSATFARGSLSLRDPVGNQSASDRTMIGDNSFPRCPCVEVTAESCEHFGWVRRRQGVDRTEAKKTSLAVRTGAAQ